MHGRSHIVIARRCLPYTQVSRHGSAYSWAVGRSATRQRASRASIAKAFALRYPGGVLEKNEWKLHASAEFCGLDGKTFSNRQNVRYLTDTSRKSVEPVKVVKSSKGAYASVPDCRNRRNPRVLGWNVPNDKVRKLRSSVTKPEI